MSVFSKKQTGDAGEDRCVKYLKKHGYKILCRNFRRPCGEIDIIAENREVLAFVEVKTRQLNPLTQPYEAVDFKKRRRIINTARLYLAENEPEKFCRFDVCEIIVDKNTLKTIRINYIEGAFDAT